MKRPGMPGARFLALLLAVLGFKAGVHAHVGPFDGSRFRGTIAWTCDGNHNDEDDWAASALALALFAEFGVKDHLIHFDYNNILPATNPDWEQEHRKSVLGAVRHWGYDAARFHDCRRAPDAAIKSLAAAIESASGARPLYLVVAGPVEVLYRALQRTRPEPRRHVYCISHSRWNDGFARNYTFAYNKRVVIESGVNWVQIPDQNRGLATSPWGRKATAAEWEPWRWLQRSSEERLRFLWDRLWSVTRADGSDAGMAYFLLTGDEDATIEKVRAVLERGERPRPIAYRGRVRLEAENSTIMEGFGLIATDGEASHRLHVKMLNRRGRLATLYGQPYAPAEGRFRLILRYRALGNCTVHLQGCEGSGGDGARLSPVAGWGNWQSPEFRLCEGESLGMSFECDSQGALEVDYADLELNL